MDDFLPGQRWISDTEPQLGLGTVAAVEARAVNIAFDAAGETRTYACRGAPLTRVRFSPGDVVISHEGWTLQVESVRQQEGLLIYAGILENGKQGELHEGQLSHFIQLNRPMERLLNGQIDSVKWFNLRCLTLRHANRLACSDLWGLTGCRTSLIPHQLYIAHEVAKRHAPRVLLADEVGLGKTIEAGLILHHQILTERARRVLIIVPENLLHQWLVEMLRRFNLHFSIFDEERCQQATASTGQDNPFLTEQQILCHLEFLTAHPGRCEQALAAGWDLLIVDEAHHLRWSPDQASTEYRLVEGLAAATPGVLLLTATPEQLGMASHFARLRLLDPGRFSSFNAFLEEEKHFAPVARVIEHLLEGRALTTGDRKMLATTILEGDNQPLLDRLDDAAASEESRAAARLELVDHLLDRHGTGRVLFRNTRAAIKGFPERRVAAYPLPLPGAYRRSLARGDGAVSLETRKRLAPERLYRDQDPARQPHWTRIDPRIPWLTELLRQLRPAKVLLIATHVDTVLDIAESLKRREGLHAAVFHEGMSILERDRAAAYFAAEESGAQLMISSEIGSEGRNFQFAHHLVLFDLPLNPDLLEQRIGRLDRIGQTQTIHIHAPYLEGSAQAVLFRWYHEGLDAFVHPCPAAHAVFEQVHDELMAALFSAHGVESEDKTAPLLDTTRALRTRLNEALRQGRDRLLEYNSCRPRVANALHAQAMHEDRTSTLPAYMDAVFDCHGVSCESHSAHCYIIRPGESMVAPFPGLEEDGVNITYDRDVALVNENMQFLTWDHPMVTAAMEMVLNGETGNAALVAARLPHVKAGRLLLECLFLIAPVSGARLHAGRYMPPAVMRVLIDEDGKDLGAGIPHDAINHSQTELNRETARQLIGLRSASLRKMHRAAEAEANRQAPAILTAAHEQSRQALTREINRLRALRLSNPSIRREEIEYIKTQRERVAQAIDQSLPRLEAVRVIVAT